MDTKTKSWNNILKKWFFLCPVRHCLLLLSTAIIILFHALRGNHALMQRISDSFVRPCHRLFGRLCNYAPFSVAELIYALAIVAVLVYIIICIVKMIRKKQLRCHLYKLLMTLVMAAALFYAGFCLLWGSYYYGDSFSDRIGLSDAPISVEELETVTRWFAELANAYSDRVARDENGVFAVPRDEIMDRGAEIYGNIEKKFPSLAGDGLRPKPIFFSKVMSAIQFTGFFFPLTGEANLNMDSPACMLPSTVAHELAHQRGVAKEQEANFVSVLASLESGDETYIYSAALLAYIHLGNALYEADRAAWKPIYESLNEQVRADFADKREYWAQYEDTVVSSVSDTVYESFLESYGQNLGLKSYGACVDLLVAYYYETAAGVIK